jgi:hypothetical protein
VALGDGAGRLATDGELEADLSDLEQHQAQDEEQGVHRVAREVQAFGLDDRAVHEGHAQADDAQEPEEIGDGLVRAVRARQREEALRLRPGEGTEGLDQAVDDEVHRVGAEDHERAEDEDVQDAAVPVAVLRQLLLRDDVDEEVLNPFRDVVPADLRPFGHEQLPDAHPDGEDEEDPARAEDGEECERGENGRDGMMRHE